MLCFALFFALFSTLHAQWVCPSSPIKPSSTPSYIPYLSRAPVNVPQNYNCTYQFDIPAGYVMKMTISSDINKSDQFYYIDTLGYVNSITKQQTNAVKTLAAKSASLVVTTTSDDSWLFAKLEWVDLQNYDSKSYYSGRFTDLNDVRKQTVTYTARTLSDKIKLTVVTDDAVTDDPSLDDIFVYDGSDVTKNFLGTLRDDITSNYGYVTIVNAAGSASTSYVVANDYKTVAQYDNYQAKIVHELRDAFVSSVDSFSSTTAISYFVPDGNTLFLTNITFNQKFSNANGGISVMGGTPTDANFAAVVYDPTTSSDLFPQQFPVSTVTVVVDRSTADLTIAPTCPTYSQAFVGRKGYVFSPSYLVTNTLSAYQLQLNASTSSKFTTKIWQFVAGGYNQYMQIRIDDNNGNPTQNDVYNTTMSSRSAKTAVGTKLTIGVYNEGLRGALSKLYFEVASP